MRLVVPDNKRAHRSAPFCYKAYRAYFTAAAKLAAAASQFTKFHQAVT